MQARLFYHRPEFAILDECTSAVNREMETFLYQECQRLGITYITICHRPALKKWHQHNLHLRGNGTKAFDFVHIGDGQGGVDAVKSRVDSGSASEKSTSSTEDPTAIVLAQKSAVYKANLAKQEEQKLRSRRKMSAVEKTVRLLKIMVPGSYGAMGKLLLAIAAQTVLREA